MPDTFAPYAVIQATRDTSLSPTQRWVLTAMVMRAGTEPTQGQPAGRCWASIATLAKDTGYADAAVSRSIGELVELGIAREEVPPPGIPSRCYSFDHSAATRLKGQERPKGTRQGGSPGSPPIAGIGGDRPDPGGGSPGSKRGIRAIPNSILKPILDPIPPTPRDVDRDPEASSSPIEQGMLPWLRSELIAEHDAEEAREALSDERQLSVSEIRDVAIESGLFEEGDEDGINRYIRDWRIEEERSKRHKEGKRPRPFLALVHDRDAATLDVLVSRAVAAGFLVRAGGKARVAVADALATLARAGQLPGAPLALPLRPPTPPPSVPSEGRA